MYEQKYFATGKRKTSIARVWIEPGEGNFLINQKTPEDFFGGLSQTSALKQPLELTDCVDKFNIYANVRGGGVSGQADAIRNGIAKALLLVNPEYRAVLKKAMLLTRDSRVKERKKYGMKGARKRFQYSKR